MYGHTFRRMKSIPEQLRIGVFFGGTSPEHEVSVITGLQAVAALSETTRAPTDSSVTPVYVTKSGAWYVGDALGSIANYDDVPALLARSTEVAVASGPGRTMKLVPVRPSRWRAAEPIVLDVALAAFHGAAGENGAFQGTCEMMGVPWTGCSVAASALGMDKALAKQMVAAAGVSVVPGRTLQEHAWRDTEDEVLDALAAELGYPLIVKPVRLGSSIGIAKAADRNELDAAIEEALRFDSAVIVERCVPNLREINASVLGDGARAEVSVLEEPVSASGLLSFEDKYMRGGAGPKGAGRSAAGPKSGMASLDRKIPAPIPDAVADTVRSMALGVFAALGASGVARIDFLMDDATGTLYFNEINTIPGSFSFYLWEPAGVPFRALLERLLTLALDRYAERHERVSRFNVNLLSDRAARGLKSAK